MQCVDRKLHWQAVTDADLRVIFGYFVVLTWSSVFALKLKKRLKDKKLLTI